MKFVLEIIILSNFYRGRNDTEQNTFSIFILGH